MADDKLTEGEVQDLLRRERSGNLSETARMALTQMRQAGNFPEALPQLTTAQRIVRESALPIIGGAIGGAAGALAAPFTAGLANPITGAMVGSGLGELANQSLGITEPSMTSVGINAAGPAVPGAARAIGNTLPGAAAGLQKSMQGALGPLLQGPLADIAPAQIAREAWQAVMSTGRNVSIRTKSLGTAVSEMGAELEQLVLPTGVAGKLVKGLKELVAEEGGEATKFVPLDKFRANQVELGRIIRALDEKGGRAAGQAKQLYKAMWDDLNDAVKTAAPELRDQLATAVEATKREVAEEFLSDAVTKSVSYRLGTRQVDLNGFLTKIERNKDLLGKWLPEEEIKQLKDTIIPWAKKTPLMPSAIPRSSADKMLGAMGPDLIARMLMSPLGRESIRFMQTPAFDVLGNTLSQGVLRGPMDIGAK